MDRDWDAELKKIDQAMSEWNPPVEQKASPATAPSKSPAPAKSPSASPERIAFRHRVATWGRVGLGLLIGIGMTQWPYTHGCGFKLLVYFIGVSAIPVAGVWSAWSSWKHRMGLAHGLSIGLIVWGLVLVAREMLPRTGYARQPATWFCPAPTVPAPAPAPTTPTQPPPQAPSSGTVPPQGSPS